MSGTIYIIDLRRHSLATPTTLEDFGAILEQLGDREDGANPAFAELGRRLEARYPSRQALGDDSVWLGSPAQEAASLRSAIWNLELPAEDTIPVERFIAATATELGLVAFDDQIGIGFVPGVGIVPAERRALWEDALAAIDAGEVLADASAVRKVVLPALEGALATHGFRRLPKRESGHDIFARTLGPVRQRLALRVIHGTRCELLFSVYHDALKAFWYGLFPKAVFEQAALFVDLDFFYPGPTTYGDWSVSRPADARALVALMETKLVPLADFCRDLQGVDQLLNDESGEAVRTVKGRVLGKRRPPGSDGSEMLREQNRTWARLAIARLNGNPGEARVAAEVGALYAPPRPPNAEYGAMKEALKGLEPLVRWPDAAAYRAARRPLPESLSRREAHPRSRRAHHWEVADMLAAEAKRDPAAFWERYAGPDGPRELLSLWQAHGLTLPAEDRLPPEGLGREVRAHAPSGDRPAMDVLLLHLPPATRVDETSTLALARSGATMQLYVVRNDFQLRDGQLRPLTVFERGGITTTRRQADPPSPEQLLDYIGATLIPTSAPSGA